MGIHPLYTLTTHKNQEDLILQVKKGARIEVTMAVVNTTHRGALPEATRFCAINFQNFWLVNY